MGAELVRRSRRRILLAGAVVVALAALLGLRLLPGARALFAAKGEALPRPPAATIPAPGTIEIAELTFPCWSCSEAESWPVAFRTDLDLLAPLGTGTANAARFFAEFTVPNGRRSADNEAAAAREIENPHRKGKILRPDDPLLLEAEPWCDQASMRFYPDLFHLDGWETPVPNFLFPLKLARSWVARGLSAAEPEAAMADFRRAIRLGRLLRQEGTTIVADLVGLAAIRIGTEAIYEHALRRGDSVLALTAAVVLSEAAPQRLLTSERVTRVDLTPFVRRDAAGAFVLELPASRLDGIVAMAAGTDEPRFRGEAILDLNLVRFLGTSEQRRRALAELETLAASSDPRLAALATWSRDREPTAAALEKIFGPADGGAR